MIMAQTIMSEMIMFETIISKMIMTQWKTNKNRRGTYCWDAPFGALNVVVRTKLAFRGQYWRQRIA